MTKTNAKTKVVPVAGKKPVHPNEHCYHQLAPTFQLILGPQVQTMAVPEFCCWCPGNRLTIMIEAPEEAKNHGPSLRFVKVDMPSTVLKPRMTLLVPGQDVRQ